MMKISKTFINCYNLFSENIEKFGNYTRVKYKDIYNSNQLFWDLFWQQQIEVKMISNDIISVLLVSNWSVYALTP